MIRRWLREPLLHFLLLGVALFVVDGYVHRGRGGVESSKEIALTLDELRQLDLYFESQWRRLPTPEEFDRLVENKVQEEVLYRCRLAGCRMGETPIIFEDRRAGASKVNLKEAVRSLTLIVWLGLEAFFGWDV